MRGLNWISTGTEVPADSVELVHGPLPHALQRLGADTVSGSPLMMELEEFMQLDAPDIDEHHVVQIHGHYYKSVETTYTVSTQLHEKVLNELVCKLKAGGACAFCNVELKNAFVVCNSNPAPPGQSLPTIDTDHMGHHGHVACLDCVQGRKYLTQEAVHGCPTGLCAACWGDKLTARSGVAPTRSDVVTMASTCGLPLQTPVHVQFVDDVMAHATKAESTIEKFNERLENHEREKIVAYRHQCAEHARNNRERRRMTEEDELAESRGQQRDEYEASLNADIAQRRSGEDARRAEEEATAARLREEVAKEKKRKRKVTKAVTMAEIRLKELQTQEDGIRASMHNNNSSSTRKKRVWSDAAKQNARETREAKAQKVKDFDTMTQTLDASNVQLESGKRKWKALSKAIQTVLRDEEGRLQQVHAEYDRILNAEFHDNESEDEEDKDEGTDLITRSHALRY